MQGRIRRSVWLVTVLLVLFSALAMPAAAETPSYISLVSDRYSDLEDVYYCEGKDTVKRKPMDFTWKDGRNGQDALVLNGYDQYIRLATAQVKQLTSFTFASWVRWDGESADTLLTFYRNENYCLTVSMRGQNETDGLSVRFVLPDREPIVLTKTAPEGSTFAIAKNTWYHIAVSVSETELTVYVNGVRYLSQAIDVDFEAMRLDKLRIGTGLTPKPAMHTAFQNTRLYTSVLTAEQVALLAQDKELNSGETVTTGTLATRPTDPVTQATLANGVSDNNVDTDNTVFGLPVGMVITLGSIVVAVALLSVLFSLQGSSKPPEKEEEE